VNRRASAVVPATVAVLVMVLIPGVNTKLLTLLVAFGVLGALGVNRAVAVSTGVVVPVIVVVIAHAIGSSTSYPLVADVLVFGVGGGIASAAGVSLGRLVQRPRKLRA
jgi:hypothetical protein